MAIRNALVLLSGQMQELPAGDTLAGAAGLTTGQINNIGVPGQQGFGVGIAPSLPGWFNKLYGTEDQSADTYGNYQYQDGSIMCYVPAFFYKYGTGANGFAVNVVDIKAYSYFTDVATANAAGYALHRAFYNGGTVRPGFFVDKYLVSNNAGVASSTKNGVMLASDQRGAIAATAFSSLNGAPPNFYYGAIAAIKTRGASFFCSSLFVHGALALLANAHASASSNTTYNGWYSAGSTNFPKGCNNNALGDVNDASIVYLADGTGTGCGKTGSANFFNKTTHNGQASGVADLNGVVWEIAPGLTSDGTSFYLLNTTVDMAAVTGSNTLATDLWGTTGLAALYTNIGATYGALTASSTNKIFGAATQVLSEATSGTAWAAAGAGIPLVGGVGGSNQFGSDYMLDYRRADMCPLVGGVWSESSYAGVWAVHYNALPDGSYADVGARAALYL